MSQFQCITRVSVPKKGILPTELLRATVEKKMRAHDGSKIQASGVLRRKQHMKKLTAKEALSLHAELCEKIDAVTSVIRERAIAQLNYNICANLPKGILSQNQLVENAVNVGFTTGAAQIHEFGCQPAIQLAYDILEDCNCHREAAALLAEAKKGGFEV